MRSTNETYWMGQFDCGGYELRVVSRSKLGVQMALFNAYREQRGKLLSLETDFKTFDEMNDFFGCFISEAKLDEVIWP